MSGGTRLWQPIIPWRLLSVEGGTRAELLEIYDTPFIRSRCLDFDSGKGRIYRDGDRALTEYPPRLSSDWIPPCRHSREQIVRRIAIAAGDLLEMLFRTRIFFDVPDEQRTELARTHSSTLRLHRVMMDHILKQRSES